MPEARLPDMGCGGADESSCAALNHGVRPSVFLPLFKGLPWVWSLACEIELELQGLMSRLEPSWPWVKQSAAVVSHGAVEPQS